MNRVSIENRTRRKQDAVYSAIVRYMRDHDGRAPTYRWLCAECGISSTSMMARYIGALVERGYLVIDGKQEARAIRLVRDGKRGVA